jgi:hypothetical protein
MTRATCWLAGVVIALGGSGCSYAWMRPVAADHHTQPGPIRCTSSRLAPAADTYGVVQAVGMALAVEVLDGYNLHGEGDEEVSDSGRAIQIVSLGAAAVYLASAIYGFGSADECSDEKALSYRREIEDRQFDEAAPVQPPPAAPRPGCGSDADCKAGRLCLDGRCAWPPASASPNTVPAAAEPEDAAPAAPAPTPAASPSLPAP